MKVISTNIGNPITIEYKGKNVKTGIFKYPTTQPIFLNNDCVENDHVIDRRHHGGTDKACYLYSTDHYEYWQTLFPELKMQWGMFGENLSIEGLHEKDINIGDIYKIGETMVQVTQPRQPCFKLEFRFHDAQIIRKFIKSGFAGVYVRILKKGKIKPGDSVRLFEKKNAPSIYRVFELLYTNIFDSNVLKLIQNKDLAESCRKDLIKRWSDHL